MTSAAESPFFSRPPSGRVEARPSEGSRSFAGGAKTRGGFTRAWKGDLYFYDELGVFRDLATLHARRVEGEAGATEAVEQNEPAVALHALSEEPDAFARGRERW